MEAEALRPTLGVFALRADPDPATDEDLALRAREHYRESGIPEIEADGVVSARVEDGERVLGMRASATVRRVDVEEDTRAVVSTEGPLYVTDRRLLHLGPEMESIELLDIDELVMADDRILVTLVGSRGLTLDVDNPHQLRVLIAAAKAARRVADQ